MITQDATGDPRQRLRKRIGEQVSGSMGSPLDQQQEMASAPLAPAPFDATPSSQPTAAPLPPMGFGTTPTLPGQLGGLPPVGVLQQPAPLGQANPNPGRFPSPPIVQPAMKTQLMDDGGDRGNEPPPEDQPPADQPPPDQPAEPTGPDRATAVPASPTFSPQQVADIVNGWMTSNNPFHHQDANYWIQKILSSNDFQRDPQGVIDYFKGRFLEDPNNNPHTGEGGGGGGATTTPAPHTPTANDIWMQQLRDILMQRLAAAGTPVDVNAPEITSAVTAARDEGTRSAEQERTALAERLYAQGGGALGTNAINQEIQQSAERNAANVGGLRAKLIMNEVNAKRSEMQQLLQMALAAGDASSAREVQMALADLEATLRREGWGIDLAKWQAEQNARTAGAGAGG
jgi:hypothetical protein